jgi:hypothetical protein
VNILRLVLLVFAFVFLVLEAFSVIVPRVKLGWLGLAFLVIALWLLPLH